MRHCAPTYFSLSIGAPWSDASEHGAVAASAEADAAREVEAEKEVRRLNLLAAGRNVAGKVSLREWEAMLWCERLANLNDASQECCAGKGDHRAGYRFDVAAARPPSQIARIQEDSNVLIRKACLTVRVM